MSEAEKQIAEEWYQTKPVREPGLWVRCSCGHIYTLHVQTVCPKCYRWPKQEWHLPEGREEFLKQLLDNYARAEGK